MDFLFDFSWPLFKYNKILLLRGMGLKVYYKSGIVLEDNGSSVVLDPKRYFANSVVSHAHMDHLHPGALMTGETKEFLKARKKSDDAITARYGEVTRLDSFEIVLRDAGHVFGSAMAQIDGVLYTGDFNPAGGITCGKAEPVSCDTLIIESTYGRADCALPPKEVIVNDLMAWVEDETKSNPVALIGYSFGKAQELIAIMNKLHVPVVVTDDIACIADVYVKCETPLEYHALDTSSKTDEILSGNYVLIVSPKAVKSEAFRALRKLGGKAAYISGWVWIYNFFKMYDIDAQFPLSDHADFDDLLYFIGACDPKKVYTCHGFARNLAKEVEQRLHIEAEALEESHNKKQKSQKSL
jgi:Cft2 family RNA processing exonuclease